MAGKSAPAAGGGDMRAVLKAASMRLSAKPAEGGPKMNPDQSYRCKFFINSKECSLDCKSDERFESLKERIWKALPLGDEKKDQYVFKLRKFDRYFKDFETFARLLAVFQQDMDPRIEAVLVRKDQVDLAAANLDVRVKDDGSVPIQGYMDRLSHIGPAPAAERRYFVLQNTTIFYYSSEAAFYAKEQAVGSLDLSHSQALKVPGMKWTFQLIRMEESGATGKFVIRAEDETAFKLWLQHLRRMNYNLTKSRGLGSSVWVPDKAVTDCMRCDQKFSITRRKHHCRTCGAVVCGDCSPVKIALADSQEPVRVCKGCEKDFKKEQKQQKVRKVKEAVGLEVVPEVEEKDKEKEIRGITRSSLKLTAPVEGYLMKQSAAGLKPWQQRWCVLDERDKKILYYKDRKERLMGALGEIRLDAVRQCFHVKDDRVRFDIITGRKTYAFQAPTPALSSRWVTHINRIIRDISREVAPREDKVAAPVRRLKGAPEPAEVKEKEKAKPKIFMEGPLKKMSPKSGRFFSQFQERWFILSEEKGKIEYYKRSPKDFPGEGQLGSISFKSVALCKTDFTEKGKPKFSIWVDTGRQYTLVCRTEGEALQWVTNINKCASLFDSALRGPVAAPLSLSPGDLEPPPRPGGYVEADDEEDAERGALDDDDIPPPPPPEDEDPPPAGVGWPQLEKLSHRSLIPITLNIITFLPVADLAATMRVSKFWKVVTEEVLNQMDEEGAESDVGGAATDSDSDGELRMGPSSGDVKAIIIDNGTYTIRAGFAGDRRPRVVVPQTSASVMDSSEAKGDAVSLDAMNHFVDSKATWRAMRKCWAQVFEKLNVDPSEYKILITQPLLSPTYVKENYMEILFKKFKVQAVFVADSPVLTAYSYGKYTGLVVDVGQTSVQVCPIVEGFMKDDAIRRAPFLGGEASTQRMYDFLKYTSLNKFNIWDALKIATAIKEKYCFVAPDFAIAVKDPTNKITYKLPNSEEITIQRALPAIGEMYFDPKKASAEKDERLISLPEMIQESVDISEMDSRRELVENILLSGGESMMRGFVDRLNVELKRLMPHAAAYLKVHADPDRDCAVFAGGCIMAGLDMFQKSWVMQWDWAAEHAAAAAPAAAPAAPAAAAAGAAAGASAAVKKSKSRK